MKCIGVGRFIRLHFEADEIDVPVMHHSCGDLSQRCKALCVGTRVAMLILVKSGRLWFKRQRNWHGADGFRAVWLKRRDSLPGERSIRP
jgi:hypothetical protein